MFLRGGYRAFHLTRRSGIHQFKGQRHMSFWNKFTPFFWKQTELKDKPALKPEDPDTLIKSFHDHKPSWFEPEQRNHHQAQEETIERVIDPKKFELLLSTAKANLENWSKNKQPSVTHVEVIRGDWGVVAQRVTHQYGTIYGILNMANAYFFGGDFIGGGNAQEENMLLRTSCSNHIREEGSHMYLDSDGNYRYKEEMSQLINAQILMTPEELNKLSHAYGRKITRAYKIHMDTKEPEVCFRGPELYVNADAVSFFDEARPGRRIALGIKDGSFAFMHPSEIFPFHEIRSAALDLTDRDIKVNWESDAFLEWYRAETKRRIDAQLDTAATNDIRHLVLCAFGCGAFRNPANEVASIYRESIKERANFFEHIVFAIYQPGYGLDNFPVFDKELHGLPLGAKNGVRPSLLTFK